MKQLMPTSQQLSRIKVKVFGHSGVGKTTLLESLKCGYLGSFFRRKGGSGPIHRQTSKISITSIPSYVNDPSFLKLPAGTWNRWCITITGYKRVRVHDYKRVRQQGFNVRLG